jgi:hypothetical protein
VPSDLRGVTGGELLSRVVDRFGERGILIMLDLHRLDEQKIPELVCVCVCVVCVCVCVWCVCVCVVCVCVFGALWVGFCTVRVRESCGCAGGCA